VGLAQEGSRRLRVERKTLIEALLRGGAAVCLPDLRGTGETSGGEDSRGRLSLVTRISASEQMLGRTLLGSRIRDLRSVLRYLGSRADLDASRVALWGDSLAPTIPADQDAAFPLGADPFPELCEPSGGLLAVLGGLFERVASVFVRGGLLSFASLLESPFFYVPHDAILPGVLTVGDLDDVVAALAPLPVRLEGLVDGRNRPASGAALEAAYAVARKAYRALEFPQRLTVESRVTEQQEIADWILSTPASGTGGRGR
jgi:hypothetical protein